MICLNKTELRKKFNICAETLDRVLDYLQLPYEIKIATNHKKVPYYNEESINKIEQFLKENKNTNLFFTRLNYERKGWSIPKIAKECNCDRIIKVKRGECGEDIICQS